MSGIPAPARKPYSSARSRRTVQALGLAAALLIGIRHLMPGEAGRGSLDAFCPFGGVETFLPYLFTGRMLQTTNLLNFTVLLGVVGTALAAGRAFCGWMCPLGAVQDFLAAGARRLTGEKRQIRGKSQIGGKKSPARLPLRLPAPVDRGLRYLKYAILAAIAAASLFAAFPPAHDICPARALFGFHLTALLWATLLSFVGVSLLVERGMCRYLCPLGGFLAVFNRFSPLRVTAGQGCSHCQRCDTACSMGIRDVPDNLRHPECVRCLECLDTCAREEALSLRLG